MSGRPEHHRRSISWGGRDIAFTVKRTARNVLKIHIEPGGRIIVHAPEHADGPDIDARVAKKGAWITATLRQIEARPPATPERRYVSGETHVFLGRAYRLAVEEGSEPHVRLDGSRMVLVARDPLDPGHCRRLIQVFHRIEAKAVFHERLEAMLPPFARRGMRRPYVVIRTLKKRWGSYTAKGRIVLNLDLIRASPSLIDYVICHEFAHAFHSDHSHEWRALMSSVMPDWEARKKLLEQLLR